jgi:hypothetical protein
MRLAAALEAIPGVPREMVEKAQDGYYHDYLSPLTFPELTLIRDLRDLARLPATPRNSRELLRNLAQDVANGKHDATKEESDDWAKSEEGQQTFRELLGENLTSATAMQYVGSRGTEDPRPHYAEVVQDFPPTAITCKCGITFTGEDWKGDPLAAIKKHMETENPK